MPMHVMILKNYFCRDAFKTLLVSSPDRGIYWEETLCLQTTDVNGMAANGLGWKLGQLKDGLAKRKELEGARRENKGQNGRPKAARTREPEWRQPVTHTNPLAAQHCTTKDDSRFII